MRILVTGGAGYIGSHTIVELIAGGHEVLAVDNLANSNAQVIDTLNEITGRAIGFIHADLCDAAATNAAFDSFKPEAVIHFAGLKAVGESTAEPIRYYHNNITGTLNLLQAMDKIACKTLVFSSSATVYGEAQYLPMDEAHPCAPSNPYGHTKHMIEQILTDWASATNGASVTNLRYFNPVGAHESGRIGEAPSGVPANLVPFLCQVASGQRKELMVFGDDYDTPDGTGLRDYIHICDLAAAHVAALDHASPGTEIYNIGTGTGATVLELVTQFERVLNRPLPYKIVDRRPGDVAKSLADPAKANTQLNWTPRRGLEDMCASAWAWTARQMEMPTP